ncbi:hypothetical protein [Nonomuraea dietziae]
MLETLTGIARRRRDLADGTRWDPRLPLLADRLTTGSLTGD